VSSLGVAARPGGTLGPVAHIGLVVPHLEAALPRLEATGVRWSSITEPVASLRYEDGTTERTRVRYVTSAGGEPRVKLIEGTARSYFRPDDAPTAVHHLSYWVGSLSAATESLVSQGYRIEVTGLSETGEPAFRYLVAPGLVRVELGLLSDRARFDAWAG